MYVCMYVCMYVYIYTSDDDTARAWYPRVAVAFASNPGVIQPRCRLLKRCHALPENSPPFFDHKWEKRRAFFRQKSEKSWIFFSEKSPTFFRFFFRKKPNFCPGFFRKKIRFLFPCFSMISIMFSRFRLRQIPPAQRLPTSLIRLFNTPSQCHARPILHISRMIHARKTERIFVVTITFDT